MRVEIGESSLGHVLVATTEKGVRAVQIGDNADELRLGLEQLFPSVEIGKGDRSSSAIANEVIRFIELPVSDLKVPLDIRGTEFQRTVWQALREIPPGSTASYTAIAKRIGRPAAIRAVAHACATNDLAVLIPCHRVVRSDGSLAGYRWGIERKRILLEREKRPA